MPAKRKSGVLLHISSLWGNTGIGTLGKEAYRFIDFLHRTEQTYWQILPIGPTGFGDSPYQSFSTFAGNPYFIDFELLCKWGYLTEDVYSSIDWGIDLTSVDYGKLYENRKTVFGFVEKAFLENRPSDFNEFCQKNDWWLGDYALFCAIKDEYGGSPFLDWEKDIRFHHDDAVNFHKEKLSNGVLYHKMLQYLFFKQWFLLKDYANKNGVQIIGDIPIYVSLDSADVWANSKFFDLNDDLIPKEVAGCPPDDFAENGQLWGNPLYNWSVLKQEKYAWWIKRLECSLQIYDVLRIDHFRGFDSYYCIPYGANTAKKGVWKKGPGIDFFNEIEKVLGKLPIIAEDLGFLTESVYNLLKKSTFPGMKVLQFAYDSRDDEVVHFEEDENKVVYTGTHDNDTILGWTKGANERDVKYAMKLLCAKNSNELVTKMMEKAMSDKANTCILTMQDLLMLDGSARMNIPSTLGGNWCWRMKGEEQLFGIEKYLNKITHAYDRI